MRQKTGLKAALAGSAAVLAFACTTHGQTVANSDFELPADGASGTDTVATGWNLQPAVGDDYTNPGQRCQFASPTPSGGTWSLWLQTFVKTGGANQTVTGITPGLPYNMTAQMAFEVPGYNNITLANQASDPNSTDNQNCYSFLTMQFEDGSGNPIGAPDTTKIVAGSVVTANHVYSPYSVLGVAPAGASQVVLTIGWNDGGLDGNTGGQSAFATDVTLSVPEPASLSTLAIGSVALLGRRRSKKSV